MNIQRSHFQLFIVSAGLIFVSKVAYCQQDSLSKPAEKLSIMHADSSAKPKAPTTHSPAKAVLYSAILPGLGQAYNHKYWKIPIIYAGLGTMAYFIIYNQQHYNTYESALKTRTNGGIDQYYNIYSSTDLVTIRDYYHRYRDLSVIGAAVFYVLNVVDAEVDAQMFTFNVDDDLSMRVSPSITPWCLSGGGMSVTPSLSIVLKLK